MCIWGVNNLVPQKIQKKKPCLHVIKNQGTYKLECCIILKQEKKNLGTRKVLSNKRLAFDNPSFM